MQRRALSGRSSCKCQAHPQALSAVQTQTWMPCRRRQRRMGAAEATGETHQWAMLLLLAAMRMGMRMGMRVRMMRMRMGPVCRCRCCRGSLRKKLFSENAGQRRGRRRGQTHSRPRRSASLLLLGRKKTRARRPRSSRERRQVVGLLLLGLLLRAALPRGNNGRSEALETGAALCCEEGSAPCCSSHRVRQGASSSGRGVVPSASCVCVALLMLDPSRSF